MVLQGSGNGDTGDVPVCARDGVPTGLRCAGCRVPICPDCFVRTPVGLKCETCAAPVPAAAALGFERRRSRIVPTAIVAALAIGVVAAFALRPGSGGDMTDEGDLGASRTPVSASGPAVAGGEAPDGLRWTIEARRDAEGRICNRFVPSRGNPSREMCDSVTDRRPFGPVRSRATIAGGKATFQSWVVVSEQTERVRVVSEDGTMSEEPTLGREAGLGARMFVSYVNRLQGVTFVALGANGEELGRVDPPVLPPPPAR